MPFVLTIDIGTESARAAVFTEAGQCVGNGVQHHPTQYPQPGWAEQDPGDWWRGAVAASRKALDQAGTRSVLAIGVATTSSSVVFLDSDGEPLRPALLWMDARAAAESARTAAIDHPALRYSGGSDSSEWLVPKAMWVARHEAATYRRAARIGEAVDFLTLRLTGEWMGSRLNATCKWNYDSRSGDLPADLYEALGVPDLGEKLPRDIRAIGTVAGTVTAAAAEALGLRNRPLVATGGIDAHLSLVALAGLSAHPVSVISGTSSAFVAELDEPAFSEEIWGPYPCALSDRWLIEGGQASSGAALTWFAERTLGLERHQIPALVDEAARVPAARHGVLALDTFMGNRTPRRDPLLRGGFLGASLGTDRAQLYRALVEGVAYGTRDVIASFERAGVDTSDLFFAGGIQHNALWLQTTADVLGRPIRLVEGTNLTLVACAVLAFAAATSRAIAEVAGTFTPSSRGIDPDPGSAEVLAEGYELYRSAVTSTREVQHGLAHLARGGEA